MKLIKNKKTALIIFKKKKSSSAIYTLLFTHILSHKMSDTLNI